MDAAFWSTMVAALLLAAASFAGAGYAAEAVGEPRLAQVLPWLALSLPLNAIATVQTALLRRAMRFRAIAIRSILGRTTGAALGIGLALSGFGVWSLVVQQLAGALITNVALAAHSPWRPRLKFSLARLRDLWSFGFQVSASQTINGMAEQAMTFLVGMLFGATALGYFTIAWRVVQLIRALIGSAVYHVGFSAFSRLQQDRTAMAAAVLQATRFACLIGFPIGCGIALLAGPAIVLLFGERWLAAEGMLVVLALEMVPGFYVLFFAAGFRAAGHANWSLMLSLVYALAGIAAIVLLAPFGLQVVVMAWVARTFLLLPVQVFLLRRLLQAPLRTILAPSVEPAVASAVMSCAVAALLWGVGNRLDNTQLVVSAVVVGAIVYAAAIAAAAPDLFKTAIRLPRFMAG
jgi:PST family polysaccharide transporter